LSDADALFRAKAAHLGVFAMQEAPSGALPLASASPGSPSPGGRRRGGAIGAGPGRPGKDGAGGEREDQGVLAHGPPEGGEVA